MKRPSPAPPGRSTSSPPARRKRSEPVRNYLEVFGLPPTLSVLRQRIEEDARKSCFATAERGDLQGFDGNVTYPERQGGPQGGRRHGGR